jgi:hypothetical protein
VVAFGGGVVGVSFLFTSLLTDHDLIRSLNERRVGLPSGGTTLRGVLAPIVRVGGVVALVAVVGIALVGVQSPLANAAVLVVWVGWWAGYTMSTYLVCDTWRLVNPWRTLAGWLPTSPRPYPEWAGAWPSVAGLLALVFLEVVTPVADRPHWLGLVVVGYSAVTVAGGAVYGEAWFANADPVSRVFGLYGRLAPIQWHERARTDGGGAPTVGSDPIRTVGDAIPSLSAPGAALARDREAVSTADATFVLALLWVTSYDGLVSTPPWNDLVRAVRAVGVPPLATNALALLVGFAVVVGVYRLAARLSRRTADSYVAPGFLARWFAPALLPIAAGYHLAHFLGYFLGLAPALVTVTLSPLAPPAVVPTLSIPGWYGTVQLGFVVLGHVLAMWVAHARAFALFPGRLAPIRSQYPFVAVMLAYTASSLWIVAQPFASPLT